MLADKLIKAALAVGLVLAVAGCSKEGPKQEGAAGQPGELADSTRMDSAPIDAADDSLVADSVD